MINPDGTLILMWKDEIISKFKFTPDEFWYKQINETARDPFRKPANEVTRADLVDFIDEQIFDRHNKNHDVILKDLGMDYYHEWNIFCKVRGTSWANSYWIRNEDEEGLLYDKDIRGQKFLLDQ